jgi:hypothetical protein
MQRIVVASFLLVVSARPAAGLVSTNVPLDHWSYDAVDKLAGYGLIDSALLTTRPVSRIEMARHIGQAMCRLRQEKDPPTVLTAIMDRLQQEFGSELTAIGLADGLSSDSFLKPVEDPYVKYVHADKPPDIENVRGDTFRRGSNYRAGFASRATLADRFAFYLHPEYTDSSESDADVDLIEGYGKVMMGPLEIEVGKDSLWWGPGRHGSILMSNNPAPFTLVKVTNPQPIELPWIFGVLGPFRAQWFLAGGEGPCPFGQALGHRLNFKPDPLRVPAVPRRHVRRSGVPRVDSSTTARSS